MIWGAVKSFRHSSTVNTNADSDMCLSSQLLKKPREGKLMKPKCPGLAWVTRGYNTTTLQTQKYINKSAKLNLKSTQEKTRGEA